MPRRFMPRSMSFKVAVCGTLVMLITASTMSTGPGLSLSADSLFLEALRAPQPPAGRGASSDLFAQLIGDWDAEVVDHLPGGIRRRQSAEMHFAYVLEGRAIQDLTVQNATTIQPYIDSVVMVSKTEATGRNARPVATVATRTISEFTTLRQEMRARRRRGCRPESD